MVSTRTRWLPVLSVLVAAPWFAEMAWGGYPFTYIPLVLLFLAPMYGGAALLIREFARRSGRGWPTILLLAAAFGVLQAGLVDQSLFNPAYGRFDFQHPVHVDGIDVSLYYLLAFVSGHVVASIAAPIGLAESCSRRGSEPWLTRRSSRVIATLYVLATIVNFLGVREDEGHGFQASAAQVLVAAATVVILIFAAVTWPRRPRTDARVPALWLLTVAGFLAYLLYLPGEGAAAFVCGIIVLVVVVVAVGTWSRSHHWGTDHTLALLLGSVLVGLVVPFLNDPYDDTVSASGELIADIAAASVCLAIVAATLVRRQTIGRGPATSGP